MPEPASGLSLSVSLSLPPDKMRNTEMKAVHCHAGQVEVREVPEPRGEGVRLRVRSAGICGSDLHMLASGFELQAILGHEMAGELDDGRPVAVEPLVPCGQCAPCRGGDYQLCERGPAMVMGVGRNGGMAELLRVPERSLVALPSGVALADACLIEPLAVALHGLRRAGFRPDQRVAVIGGGAIGQCAAAAAAASGAEVKVWARHDAQRQAAERVGARLGTGGDECFDLVIDAAGSTSALEQAVELAGPGATLLLLASYWEGLHLNGFGVCMKELRLVAAAMYGDSGHGRDIDAAAALLARRPQLGQALITHRFPLDAAQEAFDTASNRAAGAIKVVLEP